jgi:transposase-like protein
MQFDRTEMIDALGRVVQRMHCPLDVMLVCVRWYAACPPSFRDIEEMMAGRGVFVDHSTRHRGSIKLLPVLAAMCRRRKRQVGRSWRMDGTFVMVNGPWKTLYRAVNRDGDSVGFLLRARRAPAAARAFFGRALDLYGVAGKISIDKGGANTAAIARIQADSGLPIEMRPSEHLKNLVEQDHRAVQRITRPMPGFKTFRCARILIAGIEVMHMIRRARLGEVKDRSSSVANRFCLPAF